MSIVNNGLKVSVIIPCYNARSYIEGAVLSAINQSHGNHEIIIIDDGSTDGTAKFVTEKFGDKVSLICQERRGPAAARNRGLALASGDFIQFLDADDIMHEEKLEKHVQRAATLPANALTWCDWAPFLSAVGDMPSRGETYDIVMSKTVFFRNLLNENLNMPHVCFLIPRVVADLAGPWDEAMTVNDDGEYVSRIVDSSSELFYLKNAPMYFYRQQTQSWRTINSEERVYSAMVGLDKTSQIAAKNGVSLKETKLGKMYYTLLTGTYPYSARYEDDLRQRMRQLGSHTFEPNLGGKSINFIAKVFGWKFAKSLHYIWNKLIR
jgi:glycosyltransferase involved in cell wall biosynthesis